MSLPICPQQENLSFPDNRIPAFSVCEIEIFARNYDQAQNGSGTRIQVIQISPFSLYSCANTLLNSGPTSYEDAKTRAMNHVAENQPIARDLQADRLGFITHVQKSAFLDDDMGDSSDKAHLGKSGFVHVVNWGESKSVIDISLDVLKKYTNVSNVDQACQLLEVAIAMDALNIFVLHNDFQKNPDESKLKGIPLIDTEKMLASINPAEFEKADVVVFPTACTALLNDIPYDIEIEVDGTAKKTHNAGVSVLPLSTDFVLAGLDAELTKAYKIRFRYVSDVPEDEEEQTVNMFVGFFNASPVPPTVIAGFKRRKITPFE
jgi:hypothetical protein